MNIFSITESQGAAVPFIYDPTSPSSIIGAVLRDNTLSSDEKITRFVQALSLLEKNKPEESEELVQSQKELKASKIIIEEKDTELSKSKVETASAKNEVIEVTRKAMGLESELEETKAEAEKKELENNSLMNELKKERDSALAEQKKLQKPVDIQKKTNKIVDFEIAKYQKRGHLASAGTAAASVGVVASIVTAIFFPPIGIITGAISLKSASEGGDTCNREYSFEKILRELKTTGYFKEKTPEQALIIINEKKNLHNIEWEEKKK